MSAVKAQTMPESSMQAGDRATNARQITAFDLATSAYRGEFKAQGIPSYSQLISDYQTGEISAKDVVRGAVQAGQLSPEALEDRGYINAVRLQLSYLGTFAG